MFFSSVKLQKLCDLFVLKARPTGGPCSKRRCEEKCAPQFKTLCFEAFILSFSSGHSKMKVCVMFRVQAEVKTSPVFFLLLTKFWVKGQWSKHRWWMAGYIERQQTTSSIKPTAGRVMMKRTVSLTQGGRLLPTALPIGPPELSRLVAEHLIGSLVRPGALTWVSGS